jgi:hypothetical protein
MVHCSLRGRCVYAFVLAAIALAGCDTLTVHPFLGTAMILDLDGAAPSQPGQHIELWGRNDHDDIIRLSYLVGSDEQRGFQIRLAIDPKDPCVINDTGYLLTDPAAYPATTNLGGVVQTADEQALQVVNRIRQVTSVDLGGMQSSSLLLAMPYDETPWPTVASNAAAADRLAACQDYWKKSPYSYTPDPAQLGTPMHGALLGPVDYQTSIPQQRFEDIYLDSPYDLGNLRELWLTLETVPPANVDPAHRGATWLLGTRSDVGRGAINFSLKGNNVSGSIALITEQRASAF